MRTNNDVALLKEMKKITPQAMKLLKMFHIFFALCWVVSALILLSLLVIPHPQSGDELYMRSRIVQIVDDYFIIPGALGSLATGLIYGMGTNWGFFKHTWIAIKWVLTILQIAFGTFVLGPYVNNNVILADQVRDIALLNDPVFRGNVLTTLICGAAQFALLLFMVVISVQKPWKSRR